MIGLIKISKDQHEFIEIFTGGGNIHLKVSFLLSYLLMSSTSFTLDICFNPCITLNPRKTALEEITMNEHST